MTAALRCDDTPTVVEYLEQGHRTLACECCQCLVREGFEDGLTEATASIYVNFLRAHVGCGALVVIAEDERGDLYVSAEVLPSREFANA